MIPVAGALRWNESNVRGFRLSIPFLLLWLLLLPLLLLASPVIFIAAICYRVRPFRAVATLFQILAAIRGTNIEVVNDRFSVLLSIF